ncbi:NAD-dependent epimerase/dehydratase family protein [Comamonas sp.]|uniref:NAD-dependent epimerase/dehydratase family protein n=1 Tax=Comamonas sp. TaxID=34028 RepID=UPI0012BD8F6C|nr:NAD-dependent epimerase/dehydratase family protein [Comamonas sp.]MPS95272.1 NAD-dependent epimerase/dehydratase family protein [Comamonas sp.]
MRVLICGGTGFLGRHIVNALALLDHDPVVRSRHSQPPLDFGACTTAEAWLAHLQGIDAVINAVGALRDRPGQDLQTLHSLAPMALFDACARAGVRRVVQVSALGAGQGGTQYATTKRAADEHLLTLGRQGLLKPVVVRPSIIFGAGGASSQLLMNLARLPLLLLPGLMRSSRIQPVAVRDLADVLAQMATSDTPEGMVEIGGPEPLSTEAFIASLRSQMGYGPASVHALPDWMSKGSARVGDQIPSLPWCSETMALLENDNVTDPQTLVRLLGRAPVAPGAMLGTVPREGHRHA